MRLLWVVGGGRRVGLPGTCADGGRYVHGSRSPARPWLQHAAAVSKFQNTGVFFKISFFLFVSLLGGVTLEPL